MSVEFYRGDDNAETIRLGGCVERCCNVISVVRDDNGGRARFFAHLELGDQPPYEVGAPVPEQDHLIVYHLNRGATVGSLLDVDLLAFAGQPDSAVRGYVTAWLLRQH